MRILWALAASLFISNFAQATVTAVSISSPSFYTTGGTITAPIAYVGMTDAMTLLSSSCGQLCNSCDTQSSYFSGSSLGSTYTEYLGPLCSIAEMNPTSSNTVTITLTVNPTATISNPTYYVQINGGVLTNSTTVLASTNGPTTLTQGTTYTISFQIVWNQICYGSDGNSLACQHSWTSPVNVGWGTSSSAFIENGTATFNYRYVASQTSTVSSSSPPTSPWASFSSGPASADWEGFYSFDAFPGDNKIYITNPVLYSNESYAVGDLSSVLTTTGNLPSAADGSGITYAGMRVYYLKTTSTADGNFQVNGGGSTTAAGHADLIYSGGSLTPAYVDGLDNLSGTDEYQISIASIDQAGILTFFTNPNAAGTYNSGNVMNFAVTPTGSTQAAQPQAVYGILDGKGCFIATAAYGSALAPQIDVFRKIRSRYLMTSSWGRKFVDWYYRNSPRAAVWVDNSEIKKSIVRGLLWPVLLWGKLALIIGFFPALFIFALGLIGLGASLFYGVRRLKSTRLLR